MLFISPPFGNYVNLSNTIPITGSFTLKKRKGLIFQIFKTLRYNFEKKGWVNKIGLRNPGIDYALQKHYKKSIISIAILQKSDISEFNKKIPDDCDLELNISCPNAEKKCIHDGINVFINDKRKWCIVKLSPLDNITLVDKLYNDGFRQFHCGNTLPVKNGGQSGPILKQYTAPLIKQIKEKYPDTEIIAGGGIQKMEDVLYYKKNGADHFSISTLFFHPLLFYRFYQDYKKYVATVC